MVEPEEQEATSSLPFKLVMIGFLLMFVGVMVLLASALLSGNGTVSGGAIIFVGPIPIVLGAGPHALLAVVVAAVLTIMGFVVFFGLRSRVSKG